MRQGELTIQLPPATMDTTGAIVARSYPLVIGCLPGSDGVRLDAVSIASLAGIIEVGVADHAGQARRQVVERSTAIPQAMADPFRPLQLTLTNMNPESAVQVSVQVSVLGPAGGIGGPARFAGGQPFGTSGAAESDYSDTSGTASVTARGAGFVATLVTNGPVIQRNIRDITGQVRVLSGTGTGKIQTSGSDRHVIIVKKDGVVLESSTDTLDLLSTVFNIDMPTAGTVRILGIAANSIDTPELAPGAVDNAAIKAGAVTRDKTDGSFARTTWRVSATEKTTSTFVNIADGAAMNVASQGSWLEGARTYSGLAIFHGEAYGDSGTIGQHKARVRFVRGATEIFSATSQTFTAEQGVNTPFTYATGFEKVESSDAGDGTGQIDVYLDTVCTTGIYTLSWVRAAILWLPAN